jgi:hypothetical protein
MALERAHEEGQPVAETVAARAVPAPGIGNRAIAAVLLGRAPEVRGRVHPSVRGLMAGRQMLMRYTHADLIRAFRDALTEAADDPDRWVEVAQRLNGLNAADISRETMRMTSAQFHGLRRAVDTHLDGWGRQPELQRILDAIAADRVRRLRPKGSALYAQYAPVSYGTAKGAEVWATIGGSVGKFFGPKNSDSCVARIAYALNQGVQAITGGSSVWFNDPKVVYEGKKGDGKRYIVSTFVLIEYLKKRWGKPDATLKSVEKVTEFRHSLRDDEVAVFCGPKHAGLIMRHYKDYYVYDRPDFMPVQVWRLP